MPRTPQSVEINEGMRKYLSAKYLKGSLNEEQREQREITIEMILDANSFFFTYFGTTLTSINQEIHQNKQDIKDMLDAADQKAQERYKQLRLTLSLVCMVITSVGVIYKFFV